MNTRIDELTRRFQVIGAERMADLPIYNPALRVEAIDFRGLHHGWIGSLITPWFINIMYISDDGGDWASMEVSRRITCRLPSGEREFVVGEDERFGKYLFISVASPTLRFKTQEAARKAAANALDRLLDPAAMTGTSGTPVRLEDGIDGNPARRKSRH